VQQHCSYAYQHHVQLEQWSGTRQVLIRLSCKAQQDSSWSLRQFVEVALQHFPHWVRPSDKVTSMTLASM
jgi:uncharacterized membrane protein